MWIVRDGEAVNAEYLVCAVRPKCDGYGYWRPCGTNYYDFCPKPFEALTGLKLKPGAPPIKIRLVKVPK